MKRFIEKKYVVRQHLLSLIAVSLTFYFAYHLMLGQRSYPRYVALHNQIERLESDYAAFNSERVDLQTQVRKLRTASLDHDLLLERARKILGARFDGEIDYMLQ